jgi:hypothetical protein
MDSKYNASITFQKSRHKAQEYKEARKGPNWKRPRHCFWCGSPIRVRGWYDHAPCPISICARTNCEAGYCWSTRCSKRRVIVLFSTFTSLTIQYYCVTVSGSTNLSSWTRGMSFTAARRDATCHNSTVERGLFCIFEGSPPPIGGDELVPTLYS